MNIKILQLTQGAKQATGLTVIIDVFRAFSVEAFIMSKGAKTIYPVAEVETALKMKEQNPDIIIIGERNGEKINGFDFGNSPTQIADVDFNGKIVVHTTSAGTQGIANATRADEIITGSLVNAKAIARYIKMRGAQEVSLVCMGLKGTQPVEEDTLCAEYIKSLLENEPFELKPRIESLKTTSGAKFFKEELSQIFPKGDFYFCTECDKFNFVLKVNRAENGLNFVEKIDV